MQIKLSKANFLDLKEAANVIVKHDSLTPSFARGTTYTKSQVKSTLQNTIGKRRGSAEVQRQMLRKGSLQS